MAPSSPLTGIGASALVNVKDIHALAAVTPDENLTDAARDIGLSGDDGTGGFGANGFWTDGYGDGYLHLQLDYPVVKGGFPFDELGASLQPQAVGKTPFRIRVASHCADQVGHGLIPGFHEMWFDWNS